MYSFKNDYSEGAHPKILEALSKASKEQNTAYGMDSHSLRAANLIREKIGRSDADVHFLEGGTQTNLTAISAFLRPYEAAVSAETGHINGHETGAVEATGHKIVTVKADDGILTPQLIQKVLDQFQNEHTVKPKLVYISDSTEIGTIYTKAILSDLCDFCRKNGLFLYLDGARLGSALTAQGNDLTLRDLAQFCDAFYIGGTKNGALFGEALVTCNPELKENFRYMLKQRGAMLAKGMVLGVQFETLFEKNLYFELAEHANHMAERIKIAVRNSGFAFLSNSPTNQIFPILPNDFIKKLSQDFDFEVWEKTDASHTAIRLVTSWATPQDEVDRFIHCFYDFFE
ncbi:threonine aldolase family protein [Caproiciproducens galactitolivorans]|uniref:Aminotransferase class V-fold PLP-dependent enzyme n=1 Tax=Caproiciproducens galactitolivorans TaxID=642589 RepID=A0ABT4BTP8_9FIRM|nr:aminotransferase class I/II-fold pyridoxal phosphate-dependent enzyme [Caproiciproducens galactitolivorans]MCY1714272.1 aminotransferase class V-fold PLP-dependent enzyme [Caproiciproducens galactitolivorans]